MTSVLNFETGRLVWMGQDRKKQTLQRFFAELSPEQLASIEAIALDMSGAYRQAILETCPHAAMVYDFFHVVAKYGREVIDRVRLDESKKQSEIGRRYIKGSRYLLLRNEENLRSDQQEQLQELLSMNEALNTVYVLKDQLKQLFTYRCPDRARRALHQWCNLATASGLPPLQRFALGLLNHADGIINHARYPIHTGVLEGIHNKIKVIKRQAYGFRDDHYFFLKVKAAFPGRLQPD
jgi:transposase